MKHVLTSILFFLLCHSLFSQTDTTWYDISWQPCKKNVASFYRPQPILTDSGYWVKDYYLSGKLQYECLSQNLETEDWVNDATWYKEDGSITGSREYRKIVKEGTLKTYYSDKQLQTITTFKNWRKDGISYTYYYDGKPAAEIPWKNNLLDGHYKSFHQSGKPKINSFYKNNLSDSTYQFFSYSGSLVESAAFLNGFPVGEMLHIENNGDTSIRFSFADGKCNGRHFFRKDFSDTMVFYTIKNNLLEGLYIDDYKKRGFFDNGRMLQWKEVDSKTGNALVEANAINDSVSNWKYYSDEGILLASGKALYHQPFGKWSFYKHSGKTMVAYDLITAETITENYNYLSLGSWRRIGLPQIFDNYGYKDRIKTELLFPKTLSAFITVFDKNLKVIATGKMNNALPVGQWYWRQKDGTTKKIDFKTGASVKQLDELITISLGNPKTEEELQYQEENVLPLDIVVTKTKSTGYYDIAAGVLAADFCLKNPKLVKALKSRLKKMLGNNFTESVEMSFDFELDPSSQPGIVKADGDEEELMTAMPLLLKK